MRYTFSKIKEDSAVTIEGSPRDLSELNTALVGILKAKDIVEYKEDASSDTAKLTLSIPYLLTNRVPETIKGFIDEHKDQPSQNPKEKNMLKYWLFEASKIGQNQGRRKKLVNYYTLSLIASQFQSAKWDESLLNAIFNFFESSRRRPNEQAIKQFAQDLPKLNQRNRSKPAEPYSQKRSSQEASPRKASISCWTKLLLCCYPSNSKKRSGHDYQELSDRPAARS